jgi:guanosine-3',5'-bis(diphosphate) 3'-pyrophosphohydrolase
MKISFDLNNYNTKEIKNILNKIKPTKKIINLQNILQEKKLGKEILLSYLLKELFNQKQITFEEIEKVFGEEIKNIVKENIRIFQVLKANYKKITSELLEELVLSLSSDLRTLLLIIIELIYDLKNKTTNNQNQKANVFLAHQIFAPLATKLGISEFKWQLEDYAFKVENQKQYDQIKKQINKTREEREEIIKNIKEELKNYFKNKKEIQIFGRPKNFYSIYKKSKTIPIQKMLDIYGVRIICNKERDCYEILGYIHSKYDFIKEAFDDYISKPKITKTGLEYKSIHTIIKHKNELIEVQIRTWQQHMKIESNLYWEYKQIKNKKIDQNLSWERQLIEWQKNLGQETTKLKNLSKRIFIFTPQNEIISLPKDSTALDFAFAVHSEIGQHTQKAIVNKELVPIDTKLKNLDKVEIITDAKTKIKRNWINFVVSEKAKTKIKRYFGIKEKLKQKMKPTLKKEKKIKLAECCSPLPGEDVIGIKTTKRKIIIHKRDCPNIKNTPDNKKIEIYFEKNKGKTKIKIIALDRLGLLAEILTTLQKNKITLISNEFEIKKKGYVQAIFEVEVKNINKLEKTLEDLKKIPSIQDLQRL